MQLLTHRHVHHFTNVHHPFLYHDAPCDRKSDAPFINSDTYLSQDCDVPFHLNDGSSDARLACCSFKYFLNFLQILRRTHGKVTNFDAHMVQCCDWPFASLTVPVRHQMAVHWHIHDAPCQGSRGASCKWQLHYSCSPWSQVSLKS